MCNTRAAKASWCHLVADCSKAVSESGTSSSHSHLLTLFLLWEHVRLTADKLKQCLKATVAQGPYSPEQRGPNPILSEHLSQSTSPRARPGPKPHRSSEIQVPSRTLEQPFPGRERLMLHTHDKPGQRGHPGNTLVSHGVEDRWEALPSSPTVVRSSSTISEGNKPFHQSHFVMRLCFIYVSRIL